VKKDKDECNYSGVEKINKLLDVDFSKLKLAV